MVFNTDYRLMQVKSIAECSKGSILQYFRPSLSYQLSLRHLFCLFLSGRFKQREHSAILSTIIKLPFVIKTSVLSIFEWPFTQILLYCLRADDSYKISSLIFDENDKKYHKMC